MTKTIYLAGGCFWGMQTRIMKASRIITRIAALLVVIFGFTGFQCSEADDNQHLCGAYTEQRAITVEEMELFESVISTIDTITEYTPVSVATQVVAGLNYKFLCRYDDRNGSTGDCYVVIYKPLQGDPELTGIEKL